MTDLRECINSFMDDCKYMRGLNPKTLKAYGIDLRQFSDCCEDKGWQEKAVIENYIKALFSKYKPRTAKRKVACLKTFFNALENNETIASSPFRTISIKRREPLVLPKVIPVPTLTKMLDVGYRLYCEDGHSPCHYKFVARDIAVMELLFATGVRVNELCSLQLDDVDVKNKYIKVNGKGSKERYIQLTNKSVIAALRNYQKVYLHEIENTRNYFINNRGDKLSEQSVRFMINKYAKLAGSNIHITPHMFRHTVATLLLEEDVDIRYIQELLGHSSITTTQIYTHISMNAQKRMLTKKHPRNKLNVKETI